MIRGVKSDPGLRAAESPSDGCHSGRRECPVQRRRPGMRDSS